MERLLEILRSIRSDVDFEKEEKLIDENIIDSFDVVTGCILFSCDTLG